MDTLSLQNIPEKLPLQMADCTVSLAWSSLLSGSGAVINADPTQPCHIDWTASPQKFDLRCTSTAHGQSISCSESPLWTEEREPVLCMVPS